MAAPAPKLESPDTATGGLLHSLRQLLATVLATVRTRGELLQVELDEERLRIAGIAVYALVAALFLTLGVLTLSFFLMLLFWDSNRLLVAGVMGVVYVLMGIVCARIARQRSRVKSKLFAASLAELAKDSERLND